MKLSFIACILLLAGTHQSVNGQTWPQPSSLVGFWPLDCDFSQESAHGDFVTNNPYQHFGEPDPVCRSDLMGPYGKYGTSYSPTFHHQSWNYWPVALPKPKFTLSFYFYSQFTKGGNIVMFDNGRWGFSVNYVEPLALELVTPHIYPITFKNVFKGKNTWNFLALTYDYATTTLQVYDNNGNVLASTNKLVLDEYKENMVVGQGWCSSWSEFTNAQRYMYPTDSIACIMLYEGILSTSDIRQLPGICESKGGVSPGPKPSTTPRPSTTPAPSNLPWPRPNSLLGFWPLDTIYENNDVSDNSISGTFPTGAILHSGPFGQSNAAMTQSKTNNPIFYAQHDTLSVPSSFTVSLFTSIRKRTTGGGIFEFIDKFGSNKAFQFRYDVSSSVNVLEVSANGNTIGKYTIIQQDAVWTYLAFVYDASTKKLSIYGRNGLIVPPTEQPQIASSSSSNNKGVRIGYATRWGQYMDLGDSVSCLMVYKEALVPWEIRQAHDACRVLHGAVPCGSPKVPLTPIPSATTTTTVPQTGQFPWIAAIRVEATKDVICSASIIDNYWLLTTAKCFGSSANLSYFSAILGAHDLDIPGTGTRTIKLAKIIKSGDDFDSLALIQTALPIDFTNDYVNDACLYDGIESNINLASRQFFNGWGENGRSSLISESLPRYVPGKILADEQCSSDWSGSSNTFDPEKHYCFSSSSTDKDVPCRGDEGGPLMAEGVGNINSGISERLVQLGVYVHRDISCSALQPPIFADILPHRTWIAENIACAVPGANYYPISCNQS